MNPPPYTPQTFPELKDADIKLLAVLLKHYSASFLPKVATYETILGSDGFEVYARGRAAGDPGAFPPREVEAAITAFRAMPYARQRAFCRAYRV